MSSWSSPAARVSGDSSTAHAVAATVIGGTFNRRGAADVLRADFSVLTALDTQLM